MNPCVYFKKKSRGFTLTELAIVIGVVGIILGAIWGAASSVREYMLVNKATQEVATITANLRKLYSSKHFITAGAGDITCSMVKAGVFPADMISQPCIVGATATYPQTPWGGDAVIFGAILNTQNFRVSFYGNSINKSRCINFITHVVGQLEDDRLEGVMTQLSAWYIVIAPPAAPPASSIAIGCDGNGAGNTSVEFDFKL